MSMNRLPAAVTLYLAEKFLRDREAVRLGRCNHSLLSALRRYRIKRLIPIERVLRSSVDSAWRIGCMQRVMLRREEDWSAESFAALPPTLTELCIGDEFNLPLPPLPPSLRTLYIWTPVQSAAGVVAAIPT